MRRLLLLGLLAGCGASAQSTTARTTTPRAEALRFPLPGATACSRGFLPGDRHFALDLPAPAGTPVLASAAGLVVRASDHPAYGLAVILLHRASAELTYTLYAHLSALAVIEGERVEAGARIGAVGATGNARGPHLHFEVMKAASPLPLRPRGPIGIPAEAYRVDPAAQLDAPPSCGQARAALGRPG